MLGDICISIQMNQRAFCWKSMATFQSRTFGLGHSILGQVTHGLWPTFLGTLRSFAVSLASTY